MKHQILLVENNSDFANTIAQYLELGGYSVLTALSPTQGRNIAASENISLAVMGIRLEDDADVNDVSGLTLAQEFSSKFPIVIYSALDSTELVKRALAPGLGIRPAVSDYISKYEGPERLLTSIREIISKQEEKSHKSEEEIIAFAFFDDQIKLVSLATDGEYRFLDEAQNLHEILYVTTSDTLVLQSLVDELESLVNDPNSREQDFQAFFERNPEFIINDDYKKAHPHIVLTKDDGDTMIPDFVLEPISENSLSDLLELKLPSAPVFVLQKRRMRFSAAVFQACAQLREYGAFFEEERNRQIVQETYGILAYRPKMIVIIGRRGAIDPIVMRRIEQDVPNLYLRTYDDVINRMKAKVDAMKKGRTT